MSPLVAGQHGERESYWGGPVQHEPQLYMIWWGHNWEVGEGIGLFTWVHMFYENLKSENEIKGSTASWQGILTQYWSNTPGPYKSAKIAAEERINNVSAPTNVSTANLNTVIDEWINSGAVHPNANAQFVILTAPGTTFEKSTLGNGKDCAWHDATEEGFGTNYEHYSYTLIPDQKEAQKEAVCLEEVPGNQEEKNRASITAAGAHEFAESVTDPSTSREYGSGEYDPYSGEVGWRETEGNGETEVADLCNENGAFQLGNKSAYIVELWDDEGGNKCSREDPPYEEPFAPSATTGGASGVGFQTATIDGSVDPNGPDTHYYFEYGTATSYGSDIPALPGGNAGFGSNSISVNEMVSGLRQGTTYHYRLVASSWAGTSYGSDQTFTTPAPRPAAVLLPGGAEDVFFRGENNGIWEATSTGGVTELGGSAGGQPAAIALSTGEVDVYFTGTNGSIWRWYFNPTSKTWSLSQLGGVTAGNPTVSAAYPYSVFFRQTEGCRGCIYQIYWSGSSWVNRALGGSAAGDPTAVTTASGEEQVYWVQAGEAGNIAEWYAKNPLGATSEWVPIDRGGTSDSDPPAPIAYPDGKESIYFRALAGCRSCVDQLYWNGATWETQWGIGALAGGVSAVAESEKEQLVYWRGQDGRLWYNYGEPAAGPWKYEATAGMAASDPSAIYNAGASVSRNVYYVDNTGGLSDMYWQSGAWHFKQLCAWPCGQQGPQPPKVNSVSPAGGAGTGGTSVTISGSYFSEVSAVKFGASSASSYTVNSSTSITVVAPPGVSTVDVTVTSKAGTSPNTPSDNFTYTPYLTSVKPAAVLLADGSEDVYYRGENGAIWQATGYGAVRELGGKAVGNPAAVALPSGEQDVYFRNPSGALWRWYYSASAHTWSLSEIGGNSAGNPTVAAADPYAVFFRTVAPCGECISELYLSGSKWENQALGGQAGGDPTAVVSATGEEQVFWAQTANGMISEWYSASPMSKEWHVTGVGGTSVNEKPAVALHADGTESVFFQAKEGCIHCIDQLYWNKAKWETQWIGGAATGDPVTADEGDNFASVYWRNANNEIWDLYGKPTYPGSEWHFDDMGGYLGGDPTEVYNSAGQPKTSLYYIDEAGGVTDLSQQFGEWHTKQLCAWPCSAKAPAAPTVVTVPRLSTTVPKQGIALSTTGGAWSGEATIAYAYQWKRCNSAGESCANVSGATSSSYTPVSADVGHTLLATVTATNGGGATPASTPASGVTTALTPTYYGSIGSLGSGNGQLNAAKYLAVSAGVVWVADQNNNRIELFAGIQQYLNTYGTAGSGNLQFKEPEGIAIDPHGYVWVADTANNRIEELNSAGTFVRAVGSLGTGPGQFKGPKGITTDSHGNVWVADSGNSRIEELNEKGEYIKTVGSSGSGNGQLADPRSLAIAANGSIWVADNGNNRVEVFKENGEYEKTIGTVGAGNLQFKKPKGIAIDQNKRVWVADTENNRVQILSESGEYLSQFGSIGTGNGQFNEPGGIGFNGSDAFVVDAKNNRVEEWVAE